MIKITDDEYKQKDKQTAKIYLTRAHLVCLDQAALFLVFDEYYEMTTNNAQKALDIFHLAIDHEQANRSQEAYEKYAEGLATTTELLRDDVSLLGNTSVREKHKNLLKFADKSIERLRKILDDYDNGKYIDEPSHYNKLSLSLPRITNEIPVINTGFVDETYEQYAPLVRVEEENRSIIKRYQIRIQAETNIAQKHRLKLELERRLAENKSIAYNKQFEWEQERQYLVDQCRKEAEQKFEVAEKVKLGTAKEEDFTKQNVYASSLQFQKEHTWFQDFSRRMEQSSTDEVALKKLLVCLLKDKSHPIACLLRQAQQKVISKISKLLTNETMLTAIDREMVYEEHFKHISKDVKNDLMIISAVTQALWNSLNTENNRRILNDVVYELYFGPTKSLLVQLIRMMLQPQEKLLEEKMLEYSSKCYDTSNVNSIIWQMHSLAEMHSPITMMGSLVNILRLIVATPMDSSTENYDTLSVGVDELMPRFTHVLLVSNMPSILSQVTFMEKFMPTEMSFGEGSYAITVVLSVISCITSNYKN